MSVDRYCDCRFPCHTDMKKSLKAGIAVHMSVDSCGSDITKILLSPDIEFVIAVMKKYKHKSLHDIRSLVLQIAYFLYFNTNKLIHLKHILYMQARQLKQLSELCLGSLVAC